MLVFAQVFSQMTSDAPQPSFHALNAVSEHAPPNACVRGLCAGARIRQRQCLAFVSLDPSWERMRFTHSRSLSPTQPHPQAKSVRPTANRCHASHQAHVRLSPLVARKRSVLGIIFSHLQRRQHANICTRNRLHSISKDDILWWMFTHLARPTRPCCKVDTHGL